jgi:NADP-dependent 3-hydroxy acid dehydrogenase YdfG
MEDQHWFARVSGDRNPLHMDPDWAETTFPGVPVVHGVHALLWGLDTYVAHVGSARVHGLRATFLKPVVVGDEAQIESSSDGSGFKLLVQDTPMLVVKLHSATGEDRVSLDDPAPVDPAVGPRVRTLASMPGLSGLVGIPSAAEDLSRAFPHVRRAAGAQAASGLAAISALVGMECPGLHGMLADLSVFFIESPSRGPLAFRVTKVEPAFSRVDMTVNGSGITGTVGAFAGRDEPARPSEDTIRALVSVDEFAGHQPLIVGASGGLGAATARLLRAGGAQPVLTWHRAPVAADSGHDATQPTVQLDAAEPAAGLAALAKAGWQGAQVYYFASPRIFRRRLETFQRDDLDDFLRVYVGGFHELVRELLRMRAGAPLAVFYPSSVAVDDSRPEMFEYVLAKRVGEQLCERLQQEHKELTIVVRRLPRVHTRQTLTFLNVKAEAPEHVMLPIVRAVQSTL